MFQHKPIGNNKLKCIFLEAASDQEAYISISYGAGYGDRLVTENNEMMWVGGGSSNILTNIKKKQLQEKFPGFELNVQITMDTSTINIKITDGMFTDAIDPILETLFTEKVTMEAFQQQKETSTHDFALHMKNPAFNSMMDIQEFAIPNRLFNTDLLQQDLVDVLYDDILLLNDTLFRPENAIMVAAYQDRNFNESNWLEEKIEGETAGERTVHHVFKRNNFRNMVRQVYDSREERAIGTLLFRNKPIDYKTEMELIYLQVIADIIFQENYYVNIGKDYASIVYENRGKLEFLPKVLTMKWDEKEFYKARDDYYTRLQYVKTNDAGKFISILGQYFVRDINFLSMMNIFDSVTYEAFLEYMQAIKIKLAEMKIIYSGGG
ncbi:hypothetical protein [Virgibacillus sp. YIM 98842]|uniref:hypothetical protein n=1 Tax=Virgibacillus sp. YIM 98842 TaxID=2663533 RepID=UPI0013DCBBA7|nr:hypothetical protein [Virgibacillus sp. YIM 98842]